MNTGTTVTQLDRLLEPLGFTRKETLWNRRVGSVIDVNDIKVSKSGDTVTINAGVLDTEVHKILWGSEAGEFVEQPNCTARARIGELIDGKDKWWSLGDSGTCAEVAENVAAHVLPFLERMRSRDAMRKLLADGQVTKKRYPLPIISLAILMCLLGESPRGYELLSEVQKSSGEWEQRATEVAVRLRSSWN
jgi:hypothetical protein